MRINATGALQFTISVVQILENSNSDESLRQLSRPEIVNLTVSLKFA